MEDDLDERDLRQKALSTLPPKRRDYRTRQDMKYATDVQMKGSGKDHSQRSSRSHYLSHDSGEYVHKLRDKGKLVGTVRERGRARRRSSSPSSSQSYSASRSYSSYSSSGSSTSRSHSSSSISPSHSSYSSYTRSSYSSQRSFSASPHATHRIAVKHSSLHKESQSEPRTRTVSSKLSPHHRYPPSSQWYDNDHQLHSYTSAQSPPRIRKGYPLHSRHDTHNSRDYHDYPPAKRRHTNFPEYHRLPASSERYRLRSPPPPPPPPTLQRKERIIRHVRRSPLHRSPPLRGSNRAFYSPRPPSPHSRYSPHRRRPYRRSYSPPPRPIQSRDGRPRRNMMSDHTSHSSRDLKSLCGPPIRVHDRTRPRTPERRMIRPLPRRSSHKSSSSYRSSQRVELGSRSEDHPSATVSTGSSCSKKYAPIKDKTERMGKEKERTEKDKISADDQRSSSGPPSLTSPTTAQLLWDEEEIGMEGKKDEEVKAEVTEEGEVEELDYDECMEDLDLHPTGNIDEGEGGDARQLNAKSEERQGTVNWDDAEEVEGGEEHESSVRGGDLLEDETDGHAAMHEGDDTTQSTEKDESGAHISSPIRVSPDRKRPRVKSSPRHKDHGKDKKLSVKERLYVSKNTIEEKKRRLGGNDDTSSKLPRSLANRLGPSPGLHGSKSGRRSEKSSSGCKGSALAIAAEYKRRRQAGQVSPQETARATRMTKRISVPDYKPHKQRKMEKSEENERELDKKIDSIKRRNKALEKRHKEIERDKQLYG